MAKLPTCFCLIATLLMSLAFPSLQLTGPSRRSFSLQLHLQPSPLALHIHPTSNHPTQQPLIPYLFADQPVFHFDATSQSYLHVGSARGLYLADPAPSMDLRHLFFTATLKKLGAGQLTTSKEVEGGSLVMMGSPDSGSISVIGGTGSFSFASGQAKVSVVAAGVKPAAPNLIVLRIDVQVQYDEADEVGHASE